MTTKIWTTKDAARDMHRDFWTYSVNLINECFEMEDGEMCFNLRRFVECLALRIDELMNDGDCWRGELNGFKLDAEEIARYLWACHAIKHEGNAYPPTFRGRPILD